MKDDGIIRSWTPSACGLFRHELGRVWDPALPILHWTLCNPSDADNTDDDQTAHQVIKFSRRLGFGGAIVTNLADYRTPYPSALPHDVRLAVSAVNDSYIRASLSTAAKTHGWSVAGWGNLPRRSWAAPRVQRVVDLAAEVGVELRCFGTTQAGHPKHPMARGLHRIPDDMTPVRWP